MKTLAITALLITSLAGCGSAATDPVGVEQQALGPNKLRSGQAMNSGATLLSSDGTTSLQMRQDGNLILRVNGTPVWQTNTGDPESYALMQSNGQLVIWAGDGTVQWQTVTFVAGSYAIVAPGELQIVGPTGTVITEFP